MNCSKALKVISLVVDGEASEYQKRLLEFHLLGCVSCRRAMRLSLDISKIARHLPAPVISDNLENNIREMLRTRSDIKHSEHGFRSAFLAIPAVAALLIITFTILPLSSSQESVAEPQNISMSVFQSKSDNMHVLSKSGIRTTPLSEYSRQARLITF